MAEMIKITNNHDGYFDVLAMLFSKGRRQESRNGATLEIQNLIIELASPMYAAPNGIRPGFASSIGWVEGLQLIAGITDPALTAQVQPNFRAFMEHDNAQFWGAYGPRTRDQFPIIAERLRADHDTRQAIVTIWDPKFDAAGGKKDHPCTTAFNFLVRDEKLNMSVFMRSNDAWWGWPYDAVQFAMVQRTMAGVLGLEVGTYTHHAASFHLYEAHWTAAKETLKNRNITEAWSPTPKFIGDTWEQARKRAFVTYRVASQTLPPEALETDDERRIAKSLMTRRLGTLSHELGKLV